MTLKEKIVFIEKIEKELKKGGYIKGFGGGRSRLMDANHNPILNFQNEIRNELLSLDKIEQSGLIYVLKP